MNNKKDLKDKQIISLQEKCKDIGINFDEMMLLIEKEKNKRVLKRKMNIQKEIERIINK